MGMMVGADPSVARLLKRFTELEYDALEAYRVAIESVNGDVEQSKLKEFRACHAKHIQSLVPHLQAMGEQPPRAGDWRQILTQGRVMVGGLFGDRAVLRAMAANEFDVDEAYARVVGGGEVPASLRPVFEEHLNDARLHFDWLVERVQQD